MVGKKIWWECCFSQNQHLSLKITLVNQYLSKCDVEECSLIPNSQHCHLSMIGSLMLSNLILLPKIYRGFSYHASVHLLIWEPIFSEELVSEKKLFQQTVLKRSFLKLQFVQQMSQSKVAEILQNEFFILTRRK